MIKFIPHIFLSILLSLSGVSADSLSIIAVGDIMMGSDYPENCLPPNQGKELFRDAASIIKTADISLGNLEGTLLLDGICTKKIAKGRTYAFRTPPDFAQNLADAGFDFMNLANNHMNDFGQEGITSTITTLTNVDLKYGGSNGTFGKFEIRGSNIAIVCFAFSPQTYTILEIEKAQQIVAEQARQSDIVIVSFHGGGEGAKYIHTSDTIEYFMDAPRGNVVKFTHAVIDSGADFVWGHGPHVPRALEIYKDRLIAYSLGNFCTWGFNIAEERGYAPVLKLVLDSLGTFKHGAIIPFIQKSYRSLEFDKDANAIRLIKKLSSDDFPNSAPEITDDGIVRPRNVITGESILNE